ncbi:thioredoxin domain-containing protein 3 homolog isoform X1 [Microcaecilia unicolor]|uniref:Thioredoxin domain-containing protein 3 homolog isoform X1 n=1 Tax=Microcaecilia unicolor TaxID=1415580 RepID=A0A6P7YSW2_9AMPH|nr:thioredoxin domain-containing protein 3 homolog isoform X1 [Microcaecilia unicolor]
MKGLMNELAEQGLLRDIRSSLPCKVELDLTLCFHTMPYTESLLQGIGGNLNMLPTSGNLAEDIFSKRNYASNPETEQVVILTLTGRDTMLNAGDFLRQILRPPIKKQHPDPGESNTRFELLGLKWLPRLSQSQSKEITPFEVADIPWQRSIDQLASTPALICALRGINAFVCLAERLKVLTSVVGKLSSSHGKLHSVMSLTPEMAIRQAALFFTDKDFVADPVNRPTLKYIPPPSRSYRTEGGEARRGQTESVFSYMLFGPQLLCTVLLIKPSAWAHNLAKILRKLDLEKFHVVGMKHISLTAERALELLSPEVKQDPETLQDHCSYLTSGPLIVLCLQRQNAVKKLLDLLGPEDPKKARSCDQFLWRAQYGISSVQNGFYSSLSYLTAVRDMRNFFPEGLCCAQSPILEEEEIFNMKLDPLVSLEFCQQRKIVKHEIRRQLSFLSSEPTLTQGLSLLNVLCQSTCLIFTAPMLLGSEHPPYIELLDQLISKEFVVTGVRLTRLDQTQAHLVSELLGFSDSAKCSLLMDDPCLVIAAQRDNAVTCFDSLLDSISWQKPVVQDCMQYLLYPETEKQAEALLCCFFDSLSLDSIYQIKPQAS